MQRIPELVRAVDDEADLDIGPRDRWSGRYESCRRRCTHGEKASAREVVAQSLSQLPQRTRHDVIQCEIFCALEDEATVVVVLKVRAYAGHVGDNGNSKC